MNIRRQFPWLATLLIVWNIIDIAVHVALNMAEPWRIAGNIAGIAAALFVLIGIAKPYAPHVLGGAAVLVILLNAVHSVLHGWIAASFVFISVAVILLLLWAQNISRKANAETANTGQPIYLRWYAALGATVLGLAIIALVGEQVPLELGIAPLEELHNGELVAADYWGDEPLILSAGMGFEGIIGLPEVNEETVREAGGSWYGSVTCTNGEAPDDAAFTSASPIRRDCYIIQRIL